jgi:hypothetical protein
MSPATRVTLALLVLTIGVILIGVVNDLRSRPTSVETVVRRYFASLEAGDVEAALAALAPPVQERDIAFVENLVGNRYRIAGVAVREPSLLGRFGGQPAGSTDVTVFLEVTQAIDDTRWQAGPRVPVREIDGRWYLGRPPLAPE